MSRANGRKRAASRRGGACGSKPKPSAGISGAQTGANTASANIGDGKVASAKIAEDIAFAALRLADRARSVGLSSIGQVLEIAALEASAEATARRWPSDITVSDLAANDAAAK
jgi:hypothetical protein